MAPRTASEAQPRTPTRRDVDVGTVKAIVQRHSSDRGGLIAVLEEVQADCGYLPEDALRAVADQTGRSLVDVYGIATFYRFFSLKPRGKHLICACLGTACHVRGSPRVVEELEQQLGIRAGGTTPDGEFTLETVNCLGACALGPVVVIDGVYFSKVKRTGIRALLEEARLGLSRNAEGQGDLAFPVEVSCPQCNHGLMDGAVPIDGRASIRVRASVGPRQSRLWLSSLYGSRRFVADQDLPADQALNLFCPHCHGLLAGTGDCPDCRAPMARLIVQGGGIARLCSRLSCRGAAMELA
jgi:NADH-quinone oxidoreductase subunit E